MSEAVGSATITVTLTKAPASSCSVNYATSDGTATQPGDYTSTSGTLTFTSSDTSKTFDVPIIDDSLDEPLQSLSVALSSPVNCTLAGTHNPAVLSIIDNDDPGGEPVADFSSATYSVDEGDGTATVTVTLDQAPAVSCSVNYATSNGTATQPGDYTSASGTLTFTSSDTSKTFNVTIVDDSDSESAENFSVTLSSPTNCTLAGTNNPATVTITDNEGPVAGFSQGWYIVSEAVGSATITVTLTKAPASSCSVNYATSDGTATQPGDYTSTSGTLTFTSSDTSKTFDVPIIDDSLDEPLQSLSVALSSPVNCTLAGTHNPAVLSIIDNDEPGGEPVADFSSSTYSCSEGDGTATVTVTLDQAPGSSCSVNYATSDGTAGAPGDYTSTSGTLTFTSIDTQKTFDVPIIDDGVFDEGGETFDVTLSNPIDCTLAGTNNPATLTITENDTSGSLSTVYVDFDHVDTPPQDGTSPGTAYGTFGRGLSAVETNGTIKINGSASDRESEWTGVISTAMTIQADPGGTIRIGVPGAGSAKPSVPGDGSEGGSVGQGSQADALRFLQLQLARALRDAADADGEDSESTAASHNTIYEPVVPFSAASETLRAAKADSVLAIRLRSETGIDPYSIWGPVPGRNEGEASVEWMPVDEGDLRDIWVLFRPNEMWYLDDVITLTASAETVEGESVETQTYQFQVESEEDYETRTAEPEQGIWQPEYGEDFATDGLDLTAESNEQAVVAPADVATATEPLAEGIDAPLTIGPEQVYDVPQRVWLPVPDGVDPSAVRIYYFHATGDDQGWYPAENVEGWLVPDSYLHLRTNGTTYLGFLVRHAGIVQLGIPREGENLRGDATPPDPGSP